jgi:hypothetical protein
VLRVDAKLVWIFKSPHKSRMFTLQNVLSTAQTHRPDPKPNQSMVATLAALSPLNGHNKDIRSTMDGKSRIATL